MTPLQLNRFEAKVERIPFSTCWWWIGARAKGYGIMKRPCVNAIDSAHRIAYEHFVGPIPAGLQLDHLCRNPSCVNPAHLEPVTCRENLLRGNTVTAKHAAQTHCIAGHVFNDVNTRISKRGGRECRTCGRERWRARQARPIQVPCGARTHCPHGHAYSEENTTVCRRGRRHCRTCEKDRCARRALERERVRQIAGAKP